MECIAWESIGHVGIVRVNRPEALNAVNRKTLEELLQFINEIVPKQDFRAVIITGAGEKSFISGTDLKELHAFSHQEALQFCSLGQKVTNAFGTASCVLISAINGVTLGAGLELALASDFIYASKNAQLGLPEVSLGLIPGFGGTQRLARAIGIRKAKELILSGRIITSQEALQLGIVNKVFDADDLLPECVAIAEEILKHSFKAVLQAKQAVNSTEMLNLAEGLALEREMFGVCFDSEESKKQIAAFLT